MTERTQASLREEVRERYAEAARTVLQPAAGTPGRCCSNPPGDSCCGTGSAALDSADCFGSALYAEGETDGLPEEAVLASLGCGNPLAVADLHEGERVLDLGSGGGIDVLLRARRVGPSGFAYGVDMTDDVLELARKNAAQAGAGNGAGSYVGCIAGTLSRSEYLDGLTAAGFTGAPVTFAAEAAPGLHSALIRAAKPATG